MSGSPTPPVEYGLDYKKIFGWFVLVLQRVTTVKKCLPALQFSIELFCNMVLLLLFLVRTGLTSLWSPNALFTPFLKPHTHTHTQKEQLGERTIAAKEAYIFPKRERVPCAFFKLSPRQAAVHSAQGSGFFFVVFLQWVVLCVGRATYIKQMLLSTQKKKTKTAYVKANYYDTPCATWLYGGFGPRHVAFLTVTLPEVLKSRGSKRNQKTW